MSDYDEEQVLAYEVEDDEPDQAVMPIAPVPVTVCEPVVTVETVPQHLTTTTFVLSTAHADTAVRQILPQDPLRVRAVIIVHDQPVILCHSQASAAAAANVVTNTPEPSGAYVFAGTNLPSRPIPIYGMQELWAAATIAESARVTVFSYRRTP